MYEHPRKCNAIGQRMNTETGQISGDVPPQLRACCASPHGEIPRDETGALMPPAMRPPGIRGALGRYGIQERKQRVVTLALQCGPIELPQDRSDLVGLEVIDLSCRSLLGWNAQDVRTLGICQRFPIGDEPEVAARRG
jgi:hypothetical protein